jgi:hypothetical protein
VNITVADDTSGVNTSVAPHLWYRVNNGTNPPYTDAGAMTYVAGTNWTGTIPDQNWATQLNNELQYYVSGMTDNAGNAGNSTVQSDIIQDANNLPPTVPNVTYPIGGEIVNGTINVTWGASTDPDNAPRNITYDLDYSSDNGTTWIDLADDLSTNYSSWDTTTVSDGSLYLVRVRAYDGVAYSDFDQSDATFTVDNLPPYVAQWRQNPSDLSSSTMGNVTINVTVADDGSGVNTSVNPRLWYRLNNGSNPAYTDYGPMTYVSGTEWSASFFANWTLYGGYTLEYYVSEMTDNIGRTANSSMRSDYIQMPEVFGYLDQYVYWFGRGNSSPYTEPWTDDSNPADYVVFPLGVSEEETTAHSRQVQEMHTIRAFVILLDEKGLPLSGQTVRMWVVNDEGTRIIKTASDLGNGRYSAVWEGWKQPNGAGGYKAFGSDYDMYGNFTSRNIYYVSVDINGDDISDLDLAFMAYCVGDTFWGESIAGQNPSHCEERSCEPDETHDRPDAHDGTDDNPPRSNDPICADCHGWLDGIALSYESRDYGSVHPRPNAPAWRDCTNESCHGPAMVSEQPVPGYSNGSYLINRSYYYYQNCTTCHTFLDSVYPTIGGHNSNVECKYCHINNFHSIPTLENTSGYSSTYYGTCYKDCHQTQNKHNDTVGCEECHKNVNTTPMHQSNLTAYRKTCGACHQNVSYTAPQIPAPMNHSDDPIGGEKWNQTSPGYWTKGDQKSACEYCHSNTRHDKEALGRPLNWNGNNVINSSISATSTWCTGCHYKDYSSGFETYTDMATTFNDSGLEVPPEITNGTYAPSAGGNDGTSFFNHTLSDYSDYICKECHGYLISGNNMTEFMHNVAIGKGECTDCHFSWPIMSSTPKKWINETMYDESVHGSPTGVNCTNCHTNTTDHELDYVDPARAPPQYGWKWCEDCHVVNQSTTDPESHNMTSKPQNYNVTFQGQTMSVLNVTDCTACHDATMYDTARATFNKTSGKDCRFCHTFPDREPESYY